MKKRIILSITLILLLGIGFSAYSKDTMIIKDALLTVVDHAGENFLVLKIEACSLGSNGEIHCAMQPQEQTKRIQAGPKGSFFEKLAYPG